MSNFVKTPYTTPHKPLNVYTNNGEGGNGNGNRSGGMTTPRVSPRKKRREGFCRGLLTDLILMGLLHFLLFFGCAILHTNKTSSSNLNVNTNSKTSGGFDQSNKKSMPTQPKRSFLLDDFTYEPDFPKHNRLENFPTLASEKEMAKHDRYLVHSMLYTEMLNDEYLKQHWTPKPDVHDPSSRKVCINIMMRNRQLPYINALVTTLMMSHEAGEHNHHRIDESKGAGYALLSYADMNLLDVERYDWNYDDQRMNVRKLPFLKLHRLYEEDTTWLSSISKKIGLSSSSSSGTKSDSHTRRNARLDQIEDYLRSAKVCKKSGLKWCLMMEEYTVVPITFVDALQRFVIDPLDSLLSHHGAEEISVVSLFSAYNSNLGSTMKIHDVQYSSESYENDRSKLNSERRHLGMHEYVEEYEMYPIGDDDNNGNENSDDEESSVLAGGFNTAMLFLTSIVEEKLIPMLEELKEREGRRIETETETETASCDDNFLDIEREVSIFTGAKRLRVEPSLVNRIGFYDEGQKNFNLQLLEGEKTTASTSTQNDLSLGITNWLTDPRFLFEAGEYWEGLQEYCQLETKKWIWDAYYYNPKKSCCDPEYQEVHKCTKYINE